MRLPSTLMRRRGRLVLLHLLLLLRVAFLHLLRLLLMPLFHLLLPLLHLLLLLLPLHFLRVLLSSPRLLLFEFLVLLILLLLKLLPFLVLFFVQLRLLLLIFLIQLGIARIGSRAMLHRRQIIRVHRVWRTIIANRSTAGINIATVGRGRVISAGPRGHNIFSAELSRPRRRRNRRLPAVHGSPELGIPHRFLHVLRLRRGRPDAAFAHRRFFLGCRSHIYSAISAVVTHPCHIDISFLDTRFVHVVNFRYIYIVHIPVIEEVTILPTSALIPVTKVAVPIYDSAIKSHPRAPVSGIEDVSVVAPAPIRWRP